MLDLTNFRDHPEHKDYIVFHFSQTDRAKFFEEKLQQKQLLFEKNEEDGPGARTFYAIKKRDFRIASEINDESRLKFRQPFIPDTVLRYFVLTLFFVMVGLAIIGMVMESKGG